MLQQILRDMYIEPELLIELSEEQKQILFVKMREEQVRRWKVREKEYEENETKHKKIIDGRPGCTKGVQFMKGRDGCEWVWVMGEHLDDKSIQAIIEEEAHASALLQAEKESAELRKKEEVVLMKQMEEEKRRLETEKEETEKLLQRKKEEAALYQSIKEAQKIAKQLEEEKAAKEAEEKNKLAELKDVTERKRRRSVAKFDDMRHRRSSEIYTQWQEFRIELEKTAEKGSQEVDAKWMEQERKSREAELKMREMARRARQEYRESIKQTNKLIAAAKAFSSGGSVHCRGEKPPVPPKKHLAAIQKSFQRPRQPPNYAAVVTWFREEEKPRGSYLDTDSNISPWFHGIIKRSEAERLLNEKPCGSFLVRVSERVWGYTISFRDKDRVKHFLVDSTDGNYQFLGASQIQHNSLSDLINFHKENVITISGGEKLLYACGQSVSPPDYSELINNLQAESTLL